MDGISRRVRGGWRAGSRSQGARCRAVPRPVMVDRCADAQDPRRERALQHRGHPAQRQHADLSTAVPGRGESIPLQVQADGRPDPAHRAGERRAGQPLPRQHRSLGDRLRREAIEYDDQDRRRQGSSGARPILDRARDRPGPDDRAHRRQPQAASDHRRQLPVGAAARPAGAGRDAGVVRRPASLDRGPRPSRRTGSSGSSRSTPTKPFSSRSRGPVVAGPKESSLSWPRDRRGRGISRSAS